MLSKLFKLPKKFKLNAYLLIDLTDNSIHLPNGKSIPMSQIISIDTERGVVIYRDESGHLVEEPYTEERYMFSEEKEEKETAKHTTALVYA